MDDEQVDDVDPADELEEAFEEELEYAAELEEAEATGAKRPNVFVRLYRGRDVVRLHRQPQVVVRRSPPWSSSSESLSLATRGLNEGIDFKGGQSWLVSSQTLTVSEATTVAKAAGVPLADRGAAHQPAERPEADPGHRRPAEQPAAQQQAELLKVQAALADAAHVKQSSVSVNQVGSTWGSNVTTQGHPGVDHLLHRRDRLHLVAVRVQDGAGRHRGRLPRHPGRGRDLLDLPVPGDPGHGGGHAHRPRVFAVRHRGRVRPYP